MQIKNIILSVFASMALVQAVALPQGATGTTSTTVENLFDAKKYGFCVQEAVDFFEKPAATLTLPLTGIDLLTLVGGDLDLPGLLNSGLTIAGLLAKSGGDLTIAHAIAEGAEKLLTCGTCYISGILVCAIPVPPPGLKLDSSAIGKDCIFNIRTSCGLPAPAAAPAQLAARNIPIIGDLLGGLPIIGPLLASLPIVGGLLGNSPVNGGTGLLG